MNDKFIKYIDDFVKQYNKDKTSCYKLAACIDVIKLSRFLVGYCKTAFDTNPDIFGLFLVFFQFNKTPQWGIRLIDYIDDESLKHYLEDENYKHYDINVHNCYLKILKLINQHKLNIEQSDKIKTPSWPISRVSIQLQMLKYDKSMYDQFYSDVDIVNTKQDTTDDVSDICSVIEMLKNEDGDIDEDELESEYNSDNEFKSYENYDNRYSDKEKQEILSQSSKSYNKKQFSTPQLEAKYYFNELFEPGLNK